MGRELDSQERGAVAEVFCRAEALRVVRSVTGNGDGVSTTMSEFGVGRVGGS